MKGKTKKFPFCPENKRIKAGIFEPYMNKNKSNTCTQTKKRNCDFTDRDKYLFFIGC